MAETMARVRVGGGHDAETEKEQRQHESKGSKHHDTRTATVTKVINGLARDFAEYSMLSVEPLRQTKSGGKGAKK